MRDSAYAVLTQLMPIKMTHDMPCALAHLRQPAFTASEKVLKTKPSKKRCTVTHTIQEYTSIKQVKRQEDRNDK